MRVCGGVLERVLSVRQVSGDQILRKRRTARANVSWFEGGVHAGGREGE